MRSILPVRTSEFLITQKCNLNCKYCFEKCKSNKDINWDDFLLSINSENYSVFPSPKIYTFGGEPLMNIEFMTKLINYIHDNHSLGSKDKEMLASSSIAPITTNGLLIDKYLDLLKQYKCILQISIDGPEDINDLLRVDHNNKGHFKHIMNNIQLCRDNGIDYSIHGVVSRSNYKNFTRINEFFLQESLNNPRKPIEDSLFNNYVQIIFEDDITDEDIDILLEQYKNTIEMILSDKILGDYSISTRKVVAEGFLNHRGGVCSAGTTMYSYDDEFNVFPCHRLNTSDENIKSKRFYSLKDDSVPYNFKLYLPFQEVAKRKRMNGVYLSNTNFDRKSSYWMNWCPATNWESSNDVFYIPSKYDTLEAELQRFIPLLADYYNLNIDNPKFNKH